MKTDDPKFTAHALGELDDLTPAERAGIEDLVQSDAAAAAEAAETQALAALLRRELQGEEAQALTAAQRARVLAATQAGARAERPKVVPFSRRTVLLSAIAASLIVGTGISLFHPAVNADRAALMRSSTASNQAQPGTTIPVEGLSDPIPEPPPALTQVSIADKTRFFVTAHNRSPELNLFGGPRIATWPDPLAASQLTLGETKELVPNAAWAAQPGMIGTGNEVYDMTPRMNNGGSINGTNMVDHYAEGPLGMKSSGTTISVANLSDPIPGPPPAPSQVRAESQLTLSGGTTAKALAQWEIGREWSRPYQRFDRSAAPTATSTATSTFAGPVTLVGDVTGTGQVSGTMQGRINVGPNNYAEFDTGLGNLPDSGFNNKPDEKNLAQMWRDVEEKPGTLGGRIGSGKKDGIVKQAGSGALGISAPVVLEASQGNLIPLNATSTTRHLSTPSPALGNLPGITQNSSTSTLTLSGVNTYSGGTTVISGTLSGTGVTTMRGSIGTNVSAVSATTKTGGRLELSSDGFGNDRDREDERGPLPQTEPGNTAAFDSITDNAFLAARENPLSTFSIDVDTASYAIVRRFLNERKQLPPKGAVRIEEMLNYFTYDYPQPDSDAPFSATMEVATCPWTPGHRLVRIGLKGREIAKDKRPASNLVFLIDVSGSMRPAERLPLLKRSLHLLIDQLGEEDSVAMVVYAGSSGCVLEPTHDKAAMHLALDRLEAGGSTNGGSGIQLAYNIAQRGFIKGGTNRVILATDGDWNVGITNQSTLLEMIAQKAKGGVFLTVLGFGMGNLKDAMLVKLADKGNGNYGYIDTLIEAKKLLVDQLSGTLVTIAKDVKIQVEFNPAQVSGYRLIGYEKRLLAKEDFNDDKKDAGEIGAGHTVTALYEVVPTGKDLPERAKVDPLKYQAPAAKEPGTKNQEPGTSPELLTVKLRYKAPDGDTSKLLAFPLTDTGATWEKSSGDFRFAAAVAGYGMLLRDSPHKGGATWDSVRELAIEGKGEDATGYRAEFISLLEKAQSLRR